MEIILIRIFQLKIECEISFKRFHECFLLNDEEPPQFDFQSYGITIFKTPYVIIFCNKS